MAKKATHLLTEVSISQLSRDTGFHRQTIRNAIAAAGVKAAREVGGNPRYLLKDVLPVLYQGQGDAFDPDKLKPFERKAFYQAEREKLSLQVDRGELVSSLEVEQEQGRILKIMAQALDTLPDVLERDVGLSPQQAIRVEGHCDELRNALYKELTDADSTAEASA